jgi:hypothetical protein
MISTHLNPIYACKNTKKTGTKPHFPENTASAKFAFEGLQIQIPSYGRIANPAEQGVLSNNKG